LPMLEWAAAQSNHWHMKYFLALNNWGLGRSQEALQLLNSISGEIHNAVFYLTKASLQNELGQSTIDAVKQAVQIDKSNWRSWNQLILTTEKEQGKEKALIAAEEAHKILPNNYSIGMEYANLLVLNNKEESAIEVLKGLKVLPFEGAHRGRLIWERAHLGAAIQQFENKSIPKAKDLLNAGKSWPENLGVGSPYDPDLRRFNYLLAYADQRNKRSNQFIQQEVIRQSIRKGQIPDLDQVLALKIIGNSDQDQIFNDFMPEDDLSNTPQSQWILAVVKEDLVSVKALENEYPGLFSGFDYQILKRIVSLP